MTIRIDEHRRILLCKLFLCMFEYDDFGSGGGDPESESGLESDTDQIADEYDEKNKNNSGGNVSGNSRSGNSTSKILSILKELGYSTNQSNRAPERDVEFFEHILRDAMPGDVARQESRNFFDLRKQLIPTLLLVGT